MGDFEQIYAGTFFGVEMFMKVPKELVSERNWQNAIEDYMKQREQMAIQHYKEDLFLAQMQEKAKKRFPLAYLFYIRH